jgi:hypothetical protein
MATKIFQYYLTQLVAKNHKIFLLIHQCAAHLKNATFLHNIKILFDPATAFICGNHLCIQMLLQKAADFENCSHSG